MTEEEMIEALEKAGYTDVTAISDEDERLYGFSAVRPDGEAVTRQMVVARGTSTTMIGYARQNLVGAELNPDATLGANLAGSE